MQSRSWLSEDAWPHNNALQELAQKLINFQFNDNSKDIFPKNKKGNVF